MEFRFYFPGSYETRDLIALNRVAVRLFRRWRMGIFRVVLCAVGAVLLASGILTLTTADLSGEYLPLALVPSLIGFFWLALGLGLYRFSAWSGRRLLLKNTGSITLVLSETGVTETTQYKGASNLGYSAFEAAAYYRGAYFLFLDQKHALILPERRLVGGSAAQLGSFLESHIGLPVKHF